MFVLAGFWMASATMESRRQDVKRKIRMSVKLLGCIFGTVYLLVNPCPADNRDTGLRQGTKPSSATPRRSTGAPAAYTYATREVIAENNVSKREFTLKEIVTRLTISKRSLGEQTALLFGVSHRRKGPTCPILDENPNL